MRGVVLVVRTLAAWVDEVGRATAPVELRLSLIFASMRSDA